MAPKTEGGLSLDAAKSLLRGVGLRCTAARIAVVQCLGRKPTPASPSEIADSLQEFGFDKSTIYRSLTEFSEVGLVARLDLGDSVRRFELLPVGGDGSSEHPHFMCVDCGKVQCLADFQIQLTPNHPSKEMPGEISEVLVKGHCTACQLAK